MQKSTFTFHIGLHKTATTTLQRQIFPACEGIRYLSGVTNVDRFVHAVTTQDPIYYDAEYHRKQLFDHSNGQHPALISQESLSGALYAGVGKRNLDHRSSILQNLQATIPDARIILVLRRQDNLAVSYYRQYLKVGGTESISNFYGLANSADQPIFPLERFRFRPYVESIVSLFPAGLLILVFEEFLDSRSVFLDRLSGFLKVKIPNINLTTTNATRLGSAGLEASRILNRFFRSRLNPRGLLPRVMPTVQDRWPVKGRINKKSRIRAATDEILRGSFDDNRQLDSQYQLGLAKYGYY